MNYKCPIKTTKWQADAEFSFLFSPKENSIIGLVYRKELDTYIDWCFLK